MHGFLDTAGERISIQCSLPWVMMLIIEGAGGELRRVAAHDASVIVRVEADRSRFDTSGWEVLARGAWRRAGEVVVENACTTGFDLHVRCTPEHANFIYRWRPRARERAARGVLRSRFHLLARAVLMQYPALWWAGVRGGAPLHASALSLGASTPMLTAASGIGRSTLVLDELARGGRATGDNLAVGDGTTVWGLVEPLRIQGGSGRRMPHGRHEVPMPDRIAALEPDSLVVLERGGSDHPRLSTLRPEAAARSLVTSTYAAGELRRYWDFAATLAAGTGLGPAHPPVTAVAANFAARVPCYSLALGHQSEAALADLLNTEEIAA
jgi:hypothetical protein